MKIIFFGTPKFAAQHLQHLLHTDHNVVAVVTPPDKKQGRGKKQNTCATKEIALENNLPILQPDKLNDQAFISKLQDYDAELFVVVAFRMLPKIIWQMPIKGTINLHTSLLPKYKGAAPINWVLINGEKETGITTFFINEKIDSGKIILQEVISLSAQTTAAELHEDLIKKGKELLINTIKLINNSTVNSYLKENNTSKLKAPKITKELLKIDWSKSAIEIHNLVRGTSPMLNGTEILNDVSICPSSWFILQNEEGINKRIKVLLTKVIKSNSDKVLEIDTDNKTYFHINTKKDTISILNLQLEGKKAMNVKNFLQGNKITKHYKII